MSAFTPSMPIHALGNYNINIKDPQLEKERSTDARTQKLKEDFARDGMRISVETVMLVNNHGHPHILLLQLGHSFYKLPGGELSANEPEAEGVNRILSQTFAAPGEMRAWKTCDLLCQWWRPTFDLSIYPYVPPHISYPKELRKVFLVELDEKADLYVPKNYKLVAVPLFEIFDNKESYGIIIGSLGPMLSRFNFLIANPSMAEDSAAADAPPTAPEGEASEAYAQPPQQTI